MGGINRFEKKKEKTRFQILPLPTLLKLYKCSNGKKKTKFESGKIYAEYVKIIWPCSYLCCFLLHFALVFCSLALYQRELCRHKPSPSVFALLANSQCMFKT